MEGIRIENLRSLKDTGIIDIGKLTILAGENSAGKSSFLRSLPLIKQSIETETTTPLLWYGNYVDFGSFEESVNRNSKDKKIKFTFLFNNVNNNIRSTSLYRFFRGIKTADVKLNIVKSSDKNIAKDMINEININLEDNTINIGIDNRNRVSYLKVNNSQLTELVEDYEIVTDNYNMIPMININNKFIYRQRLYTSLYDLIYTGDNKIYEELYNEVKSKVRNGTGNQTIYKIINNFSVSSKEKMLKRLRENNNISITWNKFVNSDDDRINYIMDLFIGSIIGEILMLFSFLMKKYFNNTYYMAPLRATAERYYRIQNLAIDYVDFQGRNLPMLLANMSKKEEAEFSKWVQKNFNFGISIDVSTGHISIKVIKDNETVNMADTGFGYSQIIPIITQLWVIMRKNRGDRKFTKENILLAIEQPELHLHPKMQAQLVDTFVKCIEISDKMNIDLKIIMETHSETIINRIGYLIYKENISKEKVKLYLFNKINVNETKVISGKFDDEGYLEDWPSGFFSPEEY